MWNGKTYLFAIRLICESNFTCETIVSYVELEHFTCEKSFSHVKSNVKYLLTITATDIIFMF